MMTSAFPVFRSSQDLNDVAESKLAVKEGFKCK